MKIHMNETVEERLGIKLNFITKSLTTNMTIIYETKNFRHIWQQLHHLHPLTLHAQ